MPSDRVAVVITGAVAALTMTILRALVTFPATFVALTVKLKVAAVVGVPDITPVFPFKFKPDGRLPLAKDQVIGVVPVALSV